jgi:uncharacterized protein (TIGR02996 family)
MRTFQYSDARSHKFWNIDVKGMSFTVTFGKVGTAGQAQTKEFADAAKAQAAADKLVAEKFGKGYRETTPAAPSLREALEAAIRDDPDDLAAHAAWLQEQGDPLGEFIQVQLALEQEGRSAHERKKLRQREKALLKDHQREWVGAWPTLMPTMGPEGRGQLDFQTPVFGFIRGILAEATLCSLLLKGAWAFVRAPQTRMVRHLRIGGWPYEGDEGEFDELLAEAEARPEVPPASGGSEQPSEFVLLRWPHLANLRVFQLGWTSDEVYDDFCHFQCHLRGEHAYDFVKQMPRLEELYLFAHRVNVAKIAALPLPNLRVLQVYHSYDCALKKLAGNPSLGRLTHLLFHPHAIEYGEEPYIRLDGLRAVVRSPHLTSLTHLRLRLADFVDEGCEEIVRSGILRRLKVLDLRHGCVSDAGARTLAASPDVKRLELLDLSRNDLTGAGIAALRAAGVPAVTDFQHVAANEEEEEGEGRPCFSEADYE